MAKLRIPVVLAFVGVAALVGWYWPCPDDEHPPVAALPPAPATTGPERQPASAPDVIARLAVPASDSADTDDATPAPAGSLTGLVLDLANRVLAGAQIAVRASSGSGEAGAVTDAAGRWFVADLPPGRYRVRAAAPGFVAATASASVSDATETQVETLRLAQGTTLRGIVVDSGGTGLAGATVQTAGERTTSGSDGRFEVPHVPLTPIAVEVLCPGWLSWQRSGVDPAQELRVVLPAGLVLTGAVRDATTGAPVEIYALRAARLQPLRAVQQGTPEWQLQHRIQKLQQGLAAATNPKARETDERAIAEYSDRLAALQSAVPPAPGVPDELPAATAHEAGQFVVDRLDEGLYVVEVLSPDHVFARTPPFALQRDVAVPPLRIDLSPGQRVQGLVLTADEPPRPIQGATVELLRKRAVAPEPRPSPRLQWLVGERPPEGALVARSVTDADGAFTLPCQPPGTMQVLARHPDHTTATSTPFATGTQAPVQITMLPRACLAGVVRGVAASSAGEVFVLLLGGASNLRTCTADADGSYRFERLEPGEYLVRVGLGDRDKFAADLLRGLATAAEVPPRDAVLRAGERRT
ncbi:MAG TPA: carboxypeptidase regulatory-like domain-containing protein, partial [Planctomycetota bacterium]|nr:carboxypeptidase regulatory-like domain-containing protein [Planctomycetota bacterium]